MLSVEGLPIDVIAALALGWGVAAAVHLRRRDARRDADARAGRRRAARPRGRGAASCASPTSRCGARHGSSRRTRAASPCRSTCIGRDAADARLLSKVTRSLLYRDSGPSLALTRPQQLEHRAYVLLLAGTDRRAGERRRDRGDGGLRTTTRCSSSRDPAGTPLAGGRAGACHRRGARRRVGEPRPAARGAAERTVSSWLRTCSCSTTARRRSSTSRTDRPRRHPNGARATRVELLVDDRRDRRQRARARSGTPCARAATVSSSCCR